MKADPLADRALARSYAAAIKNGDEDTYVVALNEIAIRLDLDPDETEQGLTPAAHNKIEAFVYANKEEEK